MRPERLRTIGRAHQIAFDAWGPDDVAFNRPYLGGHETRTLGPKLRTLEPLAVVRPRDGITRRLRFGVWQNEFLREFFLGPEAAAKLAQPGTDWLLPPETVSSGSQSACATRTTSSALGTARSCVDVLKRVRIRDVRRQ